MCRTRRTWQPNVQSRRFFSKVLDRFLSFRMTASVIKQVKRLQGGIDEYILTSRNEELLYPKAIKIKRNMRQRLRLRARDEALAKIAEADGAPVQQRKKIHDWHLKVPGLWAHDHGGSIGFPGANYGRHFKPERWARRPVDGHARYR